MIKVWNEKYMKYQCEEIDRQIKLINHNKFDMSEEIREVRGEKLTIVSKLLERSKLRGEESSNIPSNIETKKLDTMIEKLQQSIIKLEEEIKELIAYKSEQIHTYEKNKIIKNHHSSLVQLKMLSDNLKNELAREHEIKKLILEEEMRPRYLVYAQVNDITYDPDDDFDLFRQSNRHFHWMSLDYHKTYTKCNKSDRECDENVILHCSRNYLGDYSVYGSCDCGCGYWQYKHPPDDLSDYNLDSRHVYGYMEY